MKREKKDSIYNVETLKFKNNSELKKYYQQQWKKNKKYNGYLLHGVNLSKIYDKLRKKSAMKFLTPKSKDIILDAGCGDGKLTIKISKKAGKVYGVDITKEAYKSTKRIAPKNCIFKEMNIEKISFKPKTFDKIICVEALEHVLHPEKVLKEFNRILRDDGILIITYPANTLVNKILTKIKLRKPFPISEHLTVWDYKTLKNKLQEAKFKVIKSEGIFFDMGLLNKLKKTKKLTRIITNVQTSIKKFPSNSGWISLIAEKS